MPAASRLDQLQKNVAHRLGWEEDALNDNDICAYMKDVFSLLCNGNNRQEIKQALLQEAEEEEAAAASMMQDPAVHDVVRAQLPLRAEQLAHSAGRQPTTAPAGFSGSTALESWCDELR